MFNKIKKILPNVRLKERLLLLYVIGGIVPLLLANLYMFRSARTMMVEQTTQNEINELSFLADSLKESTSIIQDVSKRLYFDENLEHIANTHYDNYQDILEDYRKYMNISDYKTHYYQEIDSITVYMYNPTVSNNETFAYADAGIKSSDWYINTVMLEGQPYWYYDYDSMNNRNRLVLSRVLYTRNMERLGVINIKMQSKRSDSLVAERDEDTMLFYDDSALLHSNCSTVSEEDVLNEIKTEKADNGSRRVRMNGNDYLISYVRIIPDYSEHYYTFVGIRPYKEITQFAVKAALKNMIPLITCVVIAFGLVMTFSKSFAKRINIFKNEMHKAATGNFDIAESLQGHDEISELYDDLNLMIQDINKLMDRVVLEQVQKEQINTRQKEVEFKMLASQINPHFLYNTLETIRMKARVNDQTEIEELAKMLAKVMRHNIQVSESLQPIKEELRFVRYYLMIQDYRFRDRITYEITGDDERIDDLMMMPLLIQPFVENAYVHGLESREYGGLISIDFDVSSSLFITVTDNGQGMDEDELIEMNRRLNDFDDLDRTHIGVVNVNQRIKLQYGEDYGVTIESTKDSGTKVILKLPVISK